MITVAQAKALKPGTEVEIGMYFSTGFRWDSKWEVYQPDEAMRWDTDPTILNYIRSMTFPEIRSYIFSDRLYSYRLAQKGE
jgi:hypothetical protein